MIFAELLDEIRAHAESVAPCEACGYVVRVGEDDFRCVRARNMHPRPDVAFTIDADAYLAAARLGKIEWAYHTHPSKSAAPSDADRAACDACAIPFMIYGRSDDSFTSLHPKPLWSELVGKKYDDFGNNCITIVHDYMKLQHGIDIGMKVAPITDAEHDQWRMGARDLYHEFHAEAGFAVCEGEMLPGDVLTLAAFRACPTHLAIYIGDNRLLIADPVTGAVVRDLSPALRKRIVRRYRHCELRG